MKRVLLICLSLVLALVGGSAACAADGFYVIGGGGKSASVPKTGQTTSYGTRDDGALEKGVAWPTPRFTDNGNGTVTDNLTKLIWTKNANAFGLKTWGDALSAANTLASGIAGLTDGSKAGDWRLPNRRELLSLVDDGRYNPALPNTLGTGQWTEGNPFQGVQAATYWSSSTAADCPSNPWLVNFYDGSVYYLPKGTYSDYYVWCVRAGP
jgi:hypothetical protein